MGQFSFAEKRSTTLSHAVKFRLYNFFTRNGSALFTRTGDSISALPSTVGAYEKPIVTLMQALAEAGLNEALIDIGANIGLSTFYARSFFRRAYCFEPNPKVFCVLRANLFEFLEKDTYLFKFAIGDRDEAAMLTVPKDNYGGAFILNDKNSYSQEELASKDGFHQFDRANYDDLPVEVRRGRDVLGPIFAECQDGLVIKIDAEGFESIILKEIAAALPARLRYAIIFENWSQHFDPDAFMRQFSDATPKLMKLHSTVNPRAGKLMKILKLILHSRRYNLTSKPSDWVGTLVCTHPDVDIS